ncbi:hypothetical protein [Brevibacillus formosus]|uniref:hypothetical protein n=1 Tax=Brevibacillus formosus TaxID=54913 RepID=UPI003F197732
MEEQHCKVTVPYEFNQNIVNRLTRELYSGELLDSEHVDVKPLGERTGRLFVGRQGVLI